MSTNRVLAFLELLQARPGLTGPELAERLEVDVRTVRRYVRRLEDLGIPLEAERGRYGGYRLMPGYRLPPLMLTGDEAAAVVLGLLAGRRAGLTVGEGAAESALAKIQRVLPDALRDRVAAVEAMVGLTTRSAATSRPSGATLLTLADAARRRLRVRLAYRSFRGQDSERTVDPYGLVFHSGRWYLTGHDHRRGEVRTFRLDRIGRAETTEEEFAAPGEFDAVAHVMESLASVPYRYEVEVVLAMTMEEARRRIPPTVAALAPVDVSAVDGSAMDGSAMDGGAMGGGVRMTGRAERLDGMAQVLAGLGVPFTVVGPPELREEVRALARRLEEWAGQASRR